MEDGVCGQFMIVSVAHALLLQHRVPHPGGSPSQAAPMLVCSVGWHSSLIPTEWVPSTGCSPAEASCASMHPLLGHQSCQRTLPTVGSPWTAAVPRTHLPASVWGPPWAAEWQPCHHSPPQGLQITISSDSCITMSPSYFTNPVSAQ